MGHPMELLNDGMPHEFVVPMGHPNDRPMGMSHWTDVPMGRISDRPMGPIIPWDVP